MKLFRTVQMGRHFKTNRLGLVSKNKTGKRTAGKCLNKGKDWKTNLWSLSKGPSKEPSSGGSVIRKPTLGR